MKARASHYIAFTLICCSPQRAIRPGHVQKLFSKSGSYVKIERKSDPHALAAALPAAALLVEVRKKNCKTSTSLGDFTMNKNKLIMNPKQERNICRVCLCRHTCGLVCHATFVDTVQIRRRSCVCLRREHRST